MANMTKHEKQLEKELYELKLQLKETENEFLRKLLAEKDAVIEKDKVITNLNKLLEEKRNNPQKQEIKTDKIKETPQKTKPLVPKDEEISQKTKPLVPKDEVTSVKFNDRKELLVQVGQRNIFKIECINENFINKNATKPVCKRLADVMRKVGEHYSFQLNFHVGTKVYQGDITKYNKDIAEKKIMEIPVEVVSGLRQYNMYEVEESSKIQQLIESGKFDKITFIMIPKETDRGGEDPTNNNNCLLNILGKTDLTECIEIKKAISLEPNDMIPISKIPELESYLQCNIMVCNKSYLGSGHFSNNYYAYLVDDHYEKAGNDTEEKYKHELLPVSSTRRTFLTARRLPDGNYLIYTPARNEGKEETVPYATINYLGKKKNFAVWYLPNKSLTLKNAYKLYENMEKVIHKLTGYSISYCSSFNEAVLTYWKSTIPNYKKSILNETNVVNDTFCKEALRGGLIWAYEKGTYKYCNELDYKGYYQSIFKELKFPSTHGTWDLCENYDGQPLKYGLYEVQITKKECNKESPPRFRHARIFTHYEIEEMRAHNYDHKLVGRCRVWAKSKNSVHYPYLRTFATKLERFREEYPDTKMFNNMLYGILTQNNYVYADCDKGGKVKACHVKQISINKDKVTVQGHSMNDKHFKHLPLFGVMVTSYGRCKINKAMDKVGRNKVLRVQTDGFIIQGSYDKKILGDKVGDLVLKEKGDVHVYHVNKCVWNEDYKVMDIGLNLLK